MDDQVTKTPANTGQIVPDFEAIGPDQESLASWRTKNNINTSTQIRLVKLIHMRYQHPELSKISTFLHDFGMQIAKSTDSAIWFSGYGSDPYVYYAKKGPKQFLGGAFEVESYADLKKAAAMSEATGPIVQLEDAPGGGSMVTLLDPEGFPVNLVHGQTPVKPGSQMNKLVMNYEMEKPRVREFLRFQEGPAAVHKLGHFGYCVQNFEEQVKWYTTNFNLVPSDFQHIILADNTKKNVALFAHVDRGQDCVDHHTLFMSMNPTSHVHHCSFEVHDFDTQHLGHQWLTKKGYESVWGVGRHVLGSQIFDYWWDTTGNMVEHYADGDLVNEDTPVGYGLAGPEGLAVWGPEVPKAFLA
ncbi:Glyoxalase/Bleomycin resistance protein/Dihydroxybiphenyl dioxygenase [Periconia macrospinosa]|uniref:Glyoxalase/Bleomycin resistance protein/Dihydroxybiphenyl dioxygenase n=1 Tax=Periconia macrospinosa TaxID=97972 RepID=A0A2V1DDV3_9PLEO|nr:Glyoxalase/Bleomycin resistance protein/Dihydroxybiphenyl dioxygenase [Periconia macrospinosa]